METLVYIVLICLGLYFLFVKGFPWIASKYASYVFKGQVTISSLNFIRVTVKGVTLSKSSFTLHAGEISLSPNFFSHGYSSLLIARISNVEIVTFLDGSSEDKKVPGKGINLQQIVGYVCYMRFLVTVILNEVSVTLKNPKNLPGHDINIFFNKGHVFPESTKNGFVSLIAETEATELNIKPSQVKVKTANLKINTEIGLFPASVKSVEISVNNADGKLPVSFAAKFAKNG